MPEFKPSGEQYTMDDLLNIMQILRSENGCPWDRAQTHASIRMNFVEEVYEALEAIDQDDSVLLREELGDVLLQVVFHAHMEEEAKRFSFSDVVHDVCAKLVVRHPHIFSEQTAANPTEALANWNDIKRKTKGQKNGTDTLLAVSKALPGLMRAEKLHSRSQKAGLSADSKDDILAKMKERLDAISKSDDEQQMQRLIGELLFDTTALTQTCGFSAEELLERQGDRFIRNFARMEQAVTAEGKQIKDCDPKMIHDLIKDDE